MAPETVELGEGDEDYLLDKRNKENQGGGKKSNAYIQTNRKESRIQKYSQLIFNKTAKTIQRGKKLSFKQIVLGQWIFTCKRMNLDHYLTLYTFRTDLNLNLRAPIINT